MDLKERVDHVVRSVRSEAIRRGVPVRVACDTKTVLARAERGAAHRLLDRLVHDALRTADGRGLALVLRCEPEAVFLDVTHSLAAEDAGGETPWTQLALQTAAGWADHAGGSLQHAVADGEATTTLRLPAG